MNPFSFVTNPIDHLWDAIALPFKALFVVGLCYFINRFTSPEHAWWQWVAFGMSIAVLVAWARAFKTIALLAAVFYVGRWIYRNWGDAAAARFDDWVKGAGAASNAGAPARPKAATDVLRLRVDDAALREAGIAR